MTPRADLGAAFEAYKADEFDRADDICAALLNEDSNFAKAHQLRALIARKKNDLAAAEAHILAALSITPEDAESLNTYGNILRTMGRTRDAITAYDKSLKAAPNYRQAAQSLGELYLMEKDPIKAAVVFEGALVHHEKHPMLLRGLLFALKDSQQHALAMQVLGQIPPAPDLALTAGQLLSQQGQAVQAQAAFRQALAHPQTAVLAFRNLIQGIWMKDGFDGAKEAIDDMVKAAPEAGFVYIQGAELLVDMGQSGEAAELLAQCETNFGPQPDIDLARANIHIEAGEAQPALALTQRAMSGRPGDAMITASFARAALMNGAFDQALEIARKVRIHVPQDQFWIAVMATALRGLDQEHDALYDYDRLVKPYDLEAPAEYNDMTDFLAQLKAALETRHDNQHHPMGQSLRHGTQTSADLRFADDRVIQDFFQALKRPIIDYMAHIGGAENHPITRRNTGKYRISGAWSVRLQGEGYHVNHVHPEGWISSAFYVDVPEGTEGDPDKKGWIKFGEPPFDVPDGEKDVMQHEHIVAPCAGRLVLFPSYMWHGTNPIDKRASRMTLPFDVVPV